MRSMTAESARELLARGQDPSDQRKAEKARNVVEDAAAARAEARLPPEESFEHVAREWVDTRKDEWAPSYGEKILRRLEVDVFPWVGSEPVSSIAPPQLLTVLWTAPGPVDKPRLPFGLRTIKIQHS